tara:strand:+ start:108 stop:245 length:138 start_codon:yes stop_codon:yes gene_type:complete
MYNYQLKLKTEFEEVVSQLVPEEGDVHNIGKCYTGVGVALQVEIV